MEYKKLIRDFIPAIISASGRRCETLELEPGAYQIALREKLVEEALEVRGAALVDVASELADVLEVIDALIKAYNLTAEQVNQIKKIAAVNGVVLLNAYS